jgi:hypothetical protein
MTSFMIPSFSDSLRYRSYGFLFQRLSAIGICQAKQNRFAIILPLKYFHNYRKSICLQTGAANDRHSCGRKIYRCFIVKIVKCICLNSWYVFVPNTFPEAEVFNFEFFIFDRTVFVDCFMNRLL